MVLLTFSGLFAQTECTVKIVYGMNKSLPPSYTFKTDPQTEGAKYYWSFGDNSFSDSPIPTHTFKITDTYAVTVKVTKDNKVCIGELKIRFEGGTVTTATTILSGKGKVKKTTSADGCGLLITMENGTILVPDGTITTFEFKDGQYVELAYELLKDKPSACPAGIMAKIHKIAVINVPVTCKVPVTFLKSTTTPATYTFKTDPQPEGSKYYWYFGDGGMSELASPTHTFTKTNTWQVNLKVLDKDGKVCYGEIKTAFEGQTNPSYTGRGVVKKLTLAGCELVIALDNAILVPFKWVPQFTLREGQYVEFTYEKFAVKESACKEGTDVKILTIKEIVQTVPCKVPVTFTKNNTTPVSYTFNTEARPAGTKYLWTFGDGGKSEQASPVYTFKTSNTYVVGLKVTDPAGKICTGETRGTFEGLANQSFSGRGKVKTLALEGCTLAIALDNGTTLIPFTMATNFLLKEGQYVEFTYEKYAVKQSGCKEGTDIKLLTVKEIPAISDCKAYFTVARDAASVKKVSFNNLSTGELVESNWSFGDATTSKEIKPTHEYAAAGVYKVCLSTVTKTGCKSEYCGEVKIESVPATSACKFDLIVKLKEAKPNTFLFYTVSTAVLKTWKWTFGDGQSSLLKEPEHTYEKTGVYEVSCVVTTEAGCTETRIIKHNVLAVTLPNCTGAINLLLFDPTNNMCNGKATVTLKDATGKDIPNVNYIWSDNRTNSTIENLCPDKVYSVQAIVEGVCQKSYSFTFMSKPIWRASTVSGVNNFTVLEPIEGVQYEWDFGNGTSLKGAAVAFNFENDGIYDVKLTAVSGTDFSEYSQQVVVMKSITGTDIINKSELKIYPNPVNEMLKINFGNPVQGKLLIEIMNIAGQIAYTQELNTEGFSHAAVNVQQLKAGIYFLRISNGKLPVADRKFIKAE
jgi:PKD repeat protein